ncbi:MAG: hypothetical protein LPK28_02735 [Bacteroidota bacterium]|nr:hypothetical protein [Bacteroidota bacterium]
MPFSIRHMDKFMAVDPSLRNSLLRQLEKDIRPGKPLNVDLEAKNFVEETFSQVQEILDVIIKSEPESFVNILYLIDVPEEQLHKKMRSGEYSSFTQLVAKAVLEREMQKVLFRKLYSQGKLDPKSNS